MKEFREEQRRRYEQADERARKLSQQAMSAPMDDYEDEDAYRYGQARTMPREPRDVDQTAVKPEPDEDQKQEQQPKDVDDEEGDISKIPRGDKKPQTGKEEKEDLMKKNKEAGKKSNKVDYQG